MMNKKGICESEILYLEYFGMFSEACTCVGMPVNPYLIECVPIVVKCTSRYICAVDCGTQY